MATELVQFLPLLGSNSRQPLIMRAGWCAAMCVILTAGLPRACHALEVVDLQRLLQEGKARELRYVEIRESPRLPKPRESRGSLRATSESLVKRVDWPQAETWRILTDRMEWMSSDGSAVKFVRFDKAPAAGALADGLRLAVSGDLMALQRRFTVSIDGDASDWSVTLKPRDAQLARFIETLTIKGVGGTMKTLVVAEVRGGRTTTELLH
jgi:hypothetical protein